MLSILRCRGLVLFASVFIIRASDARAEPPYGEDLASIRAWVESQPRTFENEVLFTVKDGRIVRSERFTTAVASFGDFDGDGDIDLLDYTAFQICLSFSGPEVTIPPACIVFDTDGDQDVDLRDAAAFAETFTGPLGGVHVEAGELFPAVASPYGYYSGEPGTSGSNALRGIARQAGYTQDDLWYEWTVIDQPIDSGEVIIANRSHSTAPYLVLSPFVLGEYLFNLTVTNLFTGESGFDVTTLRGIGCLTAGDCELTVEAGDLAPDRPSPSFYLSGTPGTAGNNALNGSANQQGVPPNAIATVWSITSQPPGSGEVTFSNITLSATAFRIGPPALAGAYVFRLTATNENTSETGSDSVTLQLLEEPRVRVAGGQSPMRIVMLRGTTTPVNVDLLYTSESDGTFIEIFGGETPSFEAPLPSDFISALTVPAGADSSATGEIIATGNRETNPPDTYFLTSRITDSVDVEPGDGSAAFQGELENPNPTPDRGSLTELVLLTTDSWVDSPSTLNPPVIDLFSEVGQVDGDDDLIHQGIGSGDSGISRAFIHNGADHVKVADINEDGFDDMIVLNDGNDVDIYFGAPDIVTDHCDVFCDVGWPGPDLNIDGDCDFMDFCVGDVNGDGHLDIVTITECTGSFVEVWLLDGADSVDLGFEDASRTYTTPSGGNIDRDLFVLCGDVGTGAGASGIADIIAVSEAYDDTGGGDASSDDGAVFVIYGRGSLPGSPDVPVNIEDDAVTGLTGSSQNGERIFNSNSGSFPGDAEDDEFGDVAALGQWDGGGLDLVVGQGNTDDPEVRIYLGGGARISRNPARVYTAPGDEDLEEGDAILADVTGDDNSELVVRSHVSDTVYIVPNGLANTGLNDSQVFKYDTAAFPLSFRSGGDDEVFMEEDDQVAAGDLDGDGVNELLIGNGNDERVIALKGPITGTIEGPTAVFRIYEDDANSNGFGRVILFGDVTGDGLVDFMMGDNSTDLVILQGFFANETP